MSSLRYEGNRVGGFTGVAGKRDYKDADTDVLSFEEEGDGVEQLCIHTSCQEDG